MFPDKDNNFRVVEVLINGKRFRRPVKRRIPLEVHDNSSVNYLLIVCYIACELGGVM